MLDGIVATNTTLSRPEPDLDVERPDVYDEKGHRVGNIIMKTQLRWNEYVPPTPSEKLDKKSRLRVIIKEAHFKKHADTFGKQDPYIKFIF